MPLSKPPVEQVLDDKGNLVFIFDPLPQPPPDLNPPLISFKDFKPRGIQMPMEGWKEGESELDGEGVPTIRFAIKHKIEESSGGKKKKAKTKAKPGEPVKRLTWWEEWAEGEDLRKASPILASDFERFENAGLEFSQQNRKFTPELQSLYDNFRLFVGLLGRATQGPMSKKKRQFHADNMAAQAEEDDDDSDFGDDPAIAPMAPGTAQEDYGAVVDGIQADSEMRAGDEGAREKRMAAFLADPLTSMRVFLSSHYYERGLFWNPRQLVNGPHLTKFFISYLIRSKVFPSPTHTAAFQASISLIDRAMIELPATSDISCALIDSVARACQGIPSWKDAVMKVAGNPYAPYAKDDLDGSQKEEKEWEKEVKNLNMETIDPSKEREPTTQSSTAPETGGWGESSAWGTTAGESAWGTTAFDAEPEEKQVNTWDIPETVHTLFSFFGPIVDPPLIYSHRVGCIEDNNVRRVLEVYGPKDISPTFGKGIQGLGVVVLGPWREWASKSSIEPKPKFFDENGQAAESDKDCREKKIRVLVDPRILKVFVKGMLIGAIFVQLVPKLGYEEATPDSTREAGPTGKEADAEMVDLNNGPNDDQEGQGQNNMSSTNSGEKKKKRKKNKNPSANASDSDEIGYVYDTSADREIAPGWWYFHNVLKVIPGFWTEETA
ncbi:hypothetical protein SISSUDRAFT_1065428 [Sistotremastrum suecicum HHB10207 ss-3]|uniref:Uncharacterized protein n=1 Tax=Sistotremastrum suecicum HHB10207 ss-3 TaxID=1314776 RepID=A0A165ZH72_9AGAM|nr:hypothetical protein SISSUDRAFT_1065428 [Sistotremastrum suecicum HHB10207 ss-3]